MALPDLIAIGVFRSAFGVPFLRRCHHSLMTSSTYHPHCRSMVRCHWQDDDSLPVNFDTPEIEFG